MVHQKIEQYSFEHAQHLIASFGLATFQEKDIAKTMVKRADEALYYAKNNAWNWVVTFDVDSQAAKGTDDIYEMLD